MNTPRTLATIYWPATVAELQTWLAAYPRTAELHGSATGLDIVEAEDEQPEQPGDVISRQLVLNKIAQLRDGMRTAVPAGIALDALTAALTIGFEPEDFVKDFERDDL